MTRCIGCHGEVPDVDGPTHRYMLSSPGCWQAFNELGLREVGGVVPAVDCYAAQHPGGSEHDRRQRQSVAIHLVTICLIRAGRLTAGDALRLRGRLNDIVLPRIGEPDWPHLAPPADPGPVTVVDVRDRTDEWAGSVWDSWSDHHATLRRWADAAIG